MNPPTEAIPWEIRRRDDGRVHTARARTAWAAWQAASTHLGFPAYSEVDCKPQAPTIVTEPTPSVIRDIVSALEAGPASLSALRGRMAARGRHHLSTAEVLLAVSSGVVEFDHLTQRYQRRAS